MKSASFEFVDTTRSVVNLVARYPLEEGFEAGRTLVSEDGEYVGVLQWKRASEKTLNQLALFRRAGFAPESSMQVPCSAKLVKALCLTPDDVARQYSPVAVKR